MNQARSPNHAPSALLSGDAGDQASVSWKPIDLGPYIRGEVKRPQPSVGLTRVDGLQVLYPGKEHSVIGEMESGKSWFALACVAAELLAGKPVLYVHFEEADPSDTVERLQLLGVPNTVILDKLDFVAPESAITLAVLDAITMPPPSLVVLDGVNEGMSLHRFEIREEHGAAQFRARLVKPFTAVGAAVLSCDHVVKDVEKRGRGPLGSIHKGNGLSGSLILLENVDPFGRGARGRSRVFVTKDRPGYLRGKGKPGKLPGKTYMGELVVDDSQTYSPDFSLRFFAPNDDELNDAGEPMPPGALNTAQLDEEVLDTIRQITAGGDAATMRRIRAKAQFRAAEVDRALERLVMDKKATEKPGARGARIFSATASQDQKQ